MGDAAISTPRPVTEIPATTSVPTAQPQMPGSVRQNPSRTALVTTISTPGPGDMMVDTEAMRKIE